MFCRHVFGNISGGFRGISRFLGNFAGFRGNTRISRVRDRAKYQKPCIYTYSQPRIVNGREVQSPIPIQREFSLFDGNGLLDAALDDVIFVRQNLRVHVIVVADL